jgi:diguanylate cyclase (GGDEF)-like protein
MAALSIKGLKERIAGFAGKGARLASNARFEMVLLVLLLLTAGAIAGKDQLLGRTVVFTPQSTASNSYLIFSDGDAGVGGKSVTYDKGGLKWSCDLHVRHPYRYCGYELFLDENRGVHGLDLSNMRSMAITMMYKGESTSFRVHLKNFDPAYSVRADDESPQYLRVEADTTPGKLQTMEFTTADFGVADWWLRKHKLAPQFGRPKFDNVTSLIFETGTEAPVGHHAFEVREVQIRTAILSDAQGYLLLLGMWIVMIVAYLGYRVVNLRKALRERRTLEALALRDAQEAARRDHLTGLFNRRGVVELFEGMAAQRRGAFDLAVILIDIDHFKRLNDTHGHDFGDQVLAAFAGVIGGSVRMGDMAARWGGEEFVVVCADVDRRGAQRIAEKLRERVESHDFGACGTVTASFGIHWAHSAEPDLSRMVALADMALYAAKAGGRNCCRMHRADMSKAA